uniref:Poly(A) polymerase n=1 Tax=Aceria tosichella TaxID=561515 RepID=A0A6G1SH11_9ACAR
MAQINKLSYPPPSQTTTAAAAAAALATNQRPNTYHQGVSQAVSDREPDEIELKRTDQLEECLRSFNLFENENELQLRCKVLSDVNRLSQKWIKELSLEKKMPAELANNCQAKIFTFGSYRLGVHNRGADIDTLLVAPKHVERDDFFDTFQLALTKMEGVEYVRAVRNAFVPLLKAKIRGIELDILFSTLALRTIPDEQELHDSNLLRGLDQQSIRSLNGCRVTDDILRVVPNHDSFRLALRAIKLWAKKRGIYSNILGYLGGVSWAILIARTCQLYPRATAATIVTKLFFVFSSWEWPKPVLLVDLCDNDLGLQVWDPRLNPSDKYHVMPIITPSYPQQNSTFNVTRSTRTIIIEQFKQAKEITDEIIKGTKSWDAFFESIDFFGLYKSFIVIRVSPQPEWVSLVESKIRTLVQSLEQHNVIKLVHAYPYPYDNPNKDDKDITWCIGLLFTQQTVDINLSYDVQNFKINILEKGEQQLKDLYPPEQLRIDIRSMSKKELGASKIIDPELIKNSIKKSSSKRNTLSESSSCDFKKKKQDNTQETDSNGV